MLELKNVCFGVENQDSAKEIIKDVSFIVPDEKFVVITGPNGGGKSTLARLIMGIEKPRSGRILLDGRRKVTCFLFHCKQRIPLLVQLPQMLCRCR